MLRSALGRAKKQGQGRTVVWSPDVADNSKPLPACPRVCMSDDEAVKMSDEMVEIRRARKQAQARSSANSQENSDVAQIGASTSKVNFDFGKTEVLSEEEKKRLRAHRLVESASNYDEDSSSLIDERIHNNQAITSKVGQQSTFNTEHAGKIKRAIQSSEDYGIVDQESNFNVGPLSDFAVDQAAQISKLSESDKKRQRALRFGAQSSQSQQSRKLKMDAKSQELEQLGMRVKDFVDTAKLYAQVQNAIFETSSEELSNESGRARAWDYFHDGFGAESKVESRVEYKVEYLDVYQENFQVVLEDSDKVNESELELEVDSTPESGDVLGTRYTNTVNVEENQIADEPSFVPVTSVSDTSEKSSEVTSIHYEEETIKPRTDDNAVIGNDEFEKSDTDEVEEIDSAFRFTTVCDLRDEVLGSPSPAPSQLRREEFRRELALKRKSTFKKAAIKTINDREPEVERLRRRKGRLAIFDANRAQSIATVLNELDSIVELDTPSERLFRLEHPEYFSKVPTESREERLQEYERARRAYDVHVAKIMVKQEGRQEKVLRKRLRELEDEELLREAKKVARQKVQEEMNWIPPSDSEIWKWREERGRLPPTEEDEDDYEKEIDEESDEEYYYYNTLEESPEPSKTWRHHPLRRNKKVLSCSEFRRRIKERERNKEAQLEHANMQETARKCQIEDLRHQVLEEERARKRQKLIDLSNERDRRDAKTIQHIREVATSKIAIGRAIRELEDKIAAAEAELSRKRRFEDMVNDQSFYMKCIRYEELQNGTEKFVKWGVEVDPETDYLMPESDHKTLLWMREQIAEERKLQEEGLVEPETSRKAKGKARRHY